VRRLRGGREEVLRGTPPLLVSVTNERGNRLRHPLMKNVALAKREKVEWVAAPDAPSVAMPVGLAAVAPAAPARRSGGGRVLTGPAEVQVAELAAYLAPWRAG